MEEAYDTELLAEGKHQVLLLNFNSWVGVTFFFCVMIYSVYFTYELHKNIQQFDFVRIIDITWQSFKSLIVVLIFGFIISFIVVGIIGNALYDFDLKNGTPLVLLLWPMYSRVFHVGAKKTYFKKHNLEKG